ncbi:hypothetical protein VCSRO104_3478 [Vibrio cholerae]|jgi:hypothetical protein|uniref:hypothetical protein n=2 Tax=Vibrio cholerae TaxID=666 RepID=UPI0004E299A9|nr:hypothetical protein [Vibrio cholerae]EGQ8391235.1 hypothetical protein [Vibrio cholerae]EGQ8444834.1 hypothetical protein [Vibrio cholerae]EGQ9189440.1 hypothetical protein [Vibrio cholerae]EII2379226.1 hypothetical protein [Vibrio cholerae]EIN5961524.1 hypothetical protein [Vibrio cholerae]
MYFSTFVLIMIITVGVIAFGATLVARLLQTGWYSVCRFMRKTRPVQVVSPLVETAEFKNGEWLRPAYACESSVATGFIEQAPIDGEVVSKPALIAHRVSKLIGRS